ncbi:MAG: hypothetical protein ACOX26_04440 [Bacilli bacterium]|jgi:Tfp pilus assembly protein PilZ
MDSIELVKPSQKFLASYLETLKEAEMFDPTYSQYFVTQDLIFLLILIIMKKE